MQLKPEQLPAQLARAPLAPVYLLAGDEPLLLQEAAGAILAKARDEGFAERLALHAEPGFDWSQLAGEASAMSLFAAKRIIEMHLADKGPGSDGAAALKAYAGAPAADTLLVVTAGRLDAAQRRSAWFKALEAAGPVVYGWPFPAERLPAWIAKRAAARGLELQDSALALLAMRTEGNLLAAAQEVERLALLFPSAGGAIDAEALRAATADSARFDIFDLPAKALAGDAAGVVRSLDRLREEGVEPVPILWALVQDLRLMLRLALAGAGGANKVLDGVRLPPARKNQIAAAAKSRRPRELLRLLRQAAHADAVCKGAAAGLAWEELITLALGMAGPAGAACQRRAQTL